MVCLSATWVQARPPFPPSPNNRHCLRPGASVGRKAHSQAGEQFNLFPTEVLQPRAGLGCLEMEAVGLVSQAGLAACEACRETAGKVQTPGSCFLVRKGGRKTTFPDER